jgi:hypothetical protein
MARLRPKRRWKVGAAAVRRRRFAAKKPREAVGRQALG